MTFQSLNPTATPSWIDCFATDDGRIVVVGGSFQLLVYNIGSNSWTDSSTIVGQVKYGPQVSANMFLNPIYIQSRILADGFTALIVCTLQWNSQPQPYYLDTSSWSLTLAIGTPQTTPVASTSSASGWGSVPGVTTVLPPAGFRQFSLAILGQDKQSSAKNHWGNGRAYIIGGYSTLVTGQVQDWDAITSFPVQQAPSNTVVMFGNSGSIKSPTRGSVVYPVSGSVLNILPGNSGASAGSNGAIQVVEVFNSADNSVTPLYSLPNGPRNTIFRGATEIGQGPQIFVHGGLTTLEIPPGTTSLTNYLDQSIGLWNGQSQTWNNKVETFTPPKSKTLMIGLGAGAAVLVLLIAGGFWFYKRRQRLRRLEEQERRVKGMALKDEDRLQKEHKRVSGEHGTGGFSPAVMATPIPFSNVAYEPLPNNSTTTTAAASGYVDGYAGRGSYSYAEPELIDDDSAVQTAVDRSSGHSPQQYPMKIMGQYSNPHLSQQQQQQDGYLSRNPSHYQPVVAAPGHPVYGTTTSPIQEHVSTNASGPSVVAHGGSSSPTLVPMNGQEGQYRISLDSRMSLPGTRPTSTFTQQSPVPYYGQDGASPNATYQALLQQYQLQQQQQQGQTTYPQAASPTFSAYGLPTAGQTHVSGGHPGLSPALSATSNSHLVANNSNSGSNQSYPPPPPSSGVHQTHPTVLRM
ncbi:hypothetical protein BGZ83_004075 [Gryganskiella cystojenkinii]|nr:hypothetical protein BGZ83_004075 [Gryganskiella cystojenkinii]